MRKIVILSAGVVALCFSTLAYAEIPAFYTGTPYMGVAQQIPGHIELADLDLGGIDVAWNTDHNRMTDGPQSGSDYRADDLDLPNINLTNRKLIDGEWAEDFWDDGMRYPSGALHGATVNDPPAFTPDMGVHYMGAAHVGDWVRLTVDVQQAGMYNVSSNWACANVNCGCSIWFNDGSDPAGPEDGVNKSGVVDLLGNNDYHIWSAFPNFAKVELTAGLQVMTFRVENADHLQYGFLDFDLVGGGAGGAGGAGGSAGLPAGGSGGAAAGGAAAGGAGGAASGGASSGGMPAAAGAIGSGGSTSQAGSTSSGGEPGSVTNNGGSTTASAGGSVPMATGNGSATPDVAQKSGCSFVASHRESDSRPILISALLMLSAVLLRRRS